MRDSSQRVSGIGLLQQLGYLHNPDTTLGKASHETSVKQEDLHITHSLYRKLLLCREIKDKWWSYWSHMIPLTVFGSQKNFCGLSPHNRPTG